MKKMSLVAALCCVAALVGCGESKVEEEKGAFAYEEAVDMSGIILAYEQFRAGEESEEERVPELAIFDEMLEDEPWLRTDTSFVLRVQEYARSEQTFLAQAEDFYNSSALMWNVWSNAEVWMLGYNWGEKFCEDSDIRLAIENISSEIIHDNDLRHEAQCYKDSLLKIMDTNPEEWDENMRLSNPLVAFQQVIGDKSYSFYNDREVFYTQYDSLLAALENMVQDRFERYMVAEEDSQVMVMLHELASCQNFDEQCALWGNWTNCEKSLLDDEWIVAVGAELMKSGHYSPVLHNIWVTWRAIVQGDFYGNSRGSVIPNTYYNKYRKSCYITCLKRIKNHPNDVFAMNCASVLGGHCNMNRFGRNYLGNESMIERAMMMPKRYPEEESEE